MTQRVFPTGRPARDVRQSLPRDVRQSLPRDVRQSLPRDVRQSLPRIAALACALPIAIGVAPALAQDPPPDPGAAPPAASPADPAPPKQTWASCIESVPPGARRPELAETFPERGLSGHAASLQITIQHGKGEHVLPEGFKIQTASDAARALALAGFALPDQNGGSPPSITREETAAGAVTRLSIPFVPLPKDPGRNDMLLPPVPIAIQRASSDIVTVCTRPHAIRVEDPTANESDPKVKPNPPPRPQREEWTLAKNLTIGAAIGAVVMAIAAWLFARWRKTPRPVKLPPPKLPWIAAMEELETIRASSLLAEGKADEYFDRVSDCVRKYLGARYGFDGLETTTDEMRGLLKRVRPQIPRLADIVSFLEDCDLVKFARVVPTETDCLDALGRGETIVRMTIPPVVPEGPGGRPRASSPDRRRDEEAA